MTTVAEIAAFLDEFAPARLAEEWDNVGLLVGRPRGSVARVMTCLTVTPATTAEAVREKADLVVTHHPMPFRAARRLTDQDPAGVMLLDLIAAGIGVYSPHTAFDSAPQGINQRLAEGLRLRGIAPLVPADEGLGTGRWGWLADEITLAALGDRVKSFLAIDRIGRVGDSKKPIRAVAVGCGAAGSLLGAARAAGCDALVLGETSLHTCLEAEATGVGLILAGHFHSERFAVEALAQVLADQFPTLHVWPSRTESDPIQWQ
ncbi:MAG TPA: Nif3-like dinuclear metal center hexameric protein [Thermoguttaceae bacterium]|nr:Nif3-like dinuclear metal center hexameric protein [Thermoguttaceae bacterium]